MISKKKVAVIGGGVSGLAAAKAFLERGHEVHGFERGPDFGGVWELSRSYPDVQTQSAKDLYCFTDLPMPDDYPEWPAGHQVHAYLHAYADKHGLTRHFSFGTDVLAVETRSDGAPGWVLKTKSKGKTRSEEFDFVTVATGQFSDKKMIEFPGEKAFLKSGGTILHSSEYTDSSVIDGKHVVVVGGAKSATDVVVNAAGSGAKSVAMVYRRNMWRVPYKLGGINFKRLVFMRFQEAQYNGWNPTRLERSIAAITKPLAWANFRGLETMLKLQLGLKKWNMVPDEPIEDVVSCNFPIVTPGLFGAFADGSATPHLANVESYGDGTVTLSTGESLNCNVMIQAAGWNHGVDFIDSEHQSKLVEDDGQYRLFRYAVNPDVPDLGFVGFNSSFTTVLSAELIANWLVRHMDGQLAHQPGRQEMNEEIDSLLKWRREERPIAMSYGGLCSAPFHFRHFDEVIADIGATKTKRTNRIAEYFSYPNARAYGEFLASAKQYQAG